MDCILLKLFSLNRWDAVLWVFPSTSQCWLHKHRADPLLSTGVSLGHFIYFHGYSSYEGPPPVCVAESFLLSSRHFHWNIPRISKMDLIIFSSKSAPTPRDTTAPLRITLASSGYNVDLHTSLLCLNSSLAAHCSHVKTHGCRQPFAVWPSPPPKLGPTPHSRSVCDRVVRSDTRLRYRHDATANRSVHRGPGVLQTLYQSLLPSVSYVTDTPALWGTRSVPIFGRGHWGLEVK